MGAWNYIGVLDRVTHDRVGLRPSHVSLLGPISHLPLFLITFLARYSPGVVTLLCGSGGESLSGTPLKGLGESGSAILPDLTRTWLEHPPNRALKPITSIVYYELSSG